MLIIFLVLATYATAINESTNHYAALGLTKDASKIEIKNAYHKLVLKYHPDRPSGDEERFKTVASAWEILGDDNKRKKYDENQELIARMDNLNVGRGATRPAATSATYDTDDVRPDPRWRSAADSTANCHSTERQKSAVPESAMPERRKTSGPTTGHSRAAHEAKATPHYHAPDRPGPQRTATGEHE